MSVLGCLGIAFVLALILFGFGPLSLDVARRMKSTSWTGRDEVQLPIVYEFVATVCLVVTLPMGVIGWV